MSLSRSPLIPEIQGLRAIAVMAVLVFHIWPEIVPGGYVGVDVFFVISGYLITGSLFKEFEAIGRIGVAAFYARRIRRLLPAATLVSLVVALCIPVFARPQWSEIASSIGASTLYVQNWFLASQAVDYLADDAKGPMNHFWSLSVEEQYYIVWPLLLWLILRFSGSAKLSPRAAFGWIVGLIGIGSLVHSIILTPEQPGIAYFATTTRAWELALGGALAVFQGKLFLSERLKGGLGWAGLAAIVAACAVYSEETSFPGYAALLPTAGAAAVILSSGGRSTWSIRSLLSLKPFQYTGDISYSLYLWHWPLIVLCGEIAGESIGLAGKGGIALASFILAHVSKVYVEDYFRSVGFPVPRTIMAGLASIALVLVAASGYWVLDTRDGTATAAQNVLRGARAITDAQYDWRKEDLSLIVPRPEQARKDIPSAYASKCHQDQRRTEVLTCNYGNAKSRLRVVMVGDSHAGHLYPAFEEIVQKESIYFQGISKSACLFSLNAIYHKKFKRLYDECLDWSKNVITWIAREKPDIVLISQSPGYPPETIEGMALAWERIREIGIEVRGIRTTPWMPFDAGKCLAQTSDWVRDCAPPRSSVFRRDLVSAVAEKLGVQVLDFSKYICDADRCPTIIGGVMVYRDSHHFTATFASTLDTAITEQLQFSRTTGAL